MSEGRWVEDGEGLVGFCGDPGAVNEAFGLEEVFSFEV